MARYDGAVSTGIAIVAIVALFISLGLLGVLVYYIRIGFGANGGGEIILIANSSVIEMAGVVQGLSNETTLQEINGASNLSCSVLGGTVLTDGRVIDPACTVLTVSGPDIQSGVLDNITLAEINAGDIGGCPSGQLDKCLGGVDSKGRCISPVCVPALESNGTALSGQNVTCPSSNGWTFPVCVSYDSNGLCNQTRCTSFELAGDVSGPPNATVLPSVNLSPTVCGAGDLWSGGSNDAQGRLIGAICVAPMNTSLNSTAACGPDLTGIYPCAVLTTTGVAAAAYSIGPTGYTLTVDTKGRITSMVANGVTMLTTTTPVTSTSITGTGLVIDLVSQFVDPFVPCGDLVNGVLCQFVANDMGIVVDAANVSAAALFNSSTVSNGNFTFHSLTLTGITTAGAVYTTPSGQLAATALTNGQVLIGSTGSTPVGATLTQGTNMAITSGAGTITLGVSSTPSFTSLTVSGLTANSFLYSGVGGLLGTTSAPTNGQLLIGSTGSAPVAAALTQGTNIVITNGAGTITIAASSTPSFTSITVSGLTANSFLYSGVGGLLTTTSAPTNGQLLIGSTGSAPVAAALTQGSNMVVTNGAGSITLAVSSTPSFTSLTVSGLTANSFLYSGTAGLLTTTAAPTNGQLLIGSTGAAPVRAALTQGNNMVITNGAGSITLAVTSSPLFSVVAISNLADNSFVYSGTSSTLTSTSAATNGQLLIGSTGAAPVAATLTQGANIAITNGAGTITIAASSTPSFTSLTVSGLTANSFLYSGVGGLLTTTSAPTNGQLLIGSTGAAPARAALTQGANMVITNGAGSITLAVNANPSFTTVTASAASNQLVLGSGGTATTITTTPAATRSLTIPDAGTSSAEVVLTAGPMQTISGPKNLQSLGFLASSTSSTSTTGTAGTGGASTTTVTGSGTSWTGSMAGGIIVFSTGTVGYITAVASGTSLTVATAITVSAGTSYTIYYSGIQSAQSLMGVQGLYVGSQNITNVAPALLNVYGADLSYDGTGPGINLYLAGTNSAVAQLKPLTADAIYMSLACAMTGPGTISPRFTSTSATANFVITKASNVLGIGLRTGISVGSTFDWVSMDQVFGITAGSPHLVTVASSAQLIVARTSDQLVFGTTNTVTFNVAAPSANRIITFPDVGADVSVAYLAGTQVFTGPKSFTALLTLGNIASSTSTTYTTGTAGTGGVSSTTVTGSGTSWTSPMVGGIIVFSNGVTGFITARGGGTTITVLTAITVAAGTSYTIYYGNLQSGQGAMALAGLILPTSGGTPTTLDYHATASGSLTVSGALSSTISYSASRVGRQVTISFGSTASVSCSANTINFNALPAGFRPVNGINFLLVVTNNNALATGAGVTLSDGTTTIYSSVTQTTFTTGQPCQVYVFALAYNAV